MKQSVRVKFGQYLVMEVATLVGNTCPLHLVYFYVSSHLCLSMLNTSCQHMNHSCA